MFIQTTFISMTEAQEIIAKDKEGEVEARWSSATGAILYIDIESGMQINDTVYFIKDRDKAIARAKAELKVD